MKKQNLTNIVLIICLFLFTFSAHASEIEPPSIQGVNCGSSVFSPPTLGATLQINNGTGASCVMDIYSIADDCSAAIDNTGATFLGTFTLNSSGFVDTGIVINSICYMALESGSGTNPIGTMFVPENSTDITTTEASIGASFTVNMDFTGAYGSVTYNGTTISGVTPGPIVLLSNITANATSITTTANGYDGNGNPLTDTIVDTLDFAPPACVSTTQNPDSTVTPVDIGTVITLDLVSTNAVSAIINGIPMTPDVDPDTNNSVTWTASYTAIEDETVEAVITNPDGEQATCQWTIDVNCADPTIDSVAAVGEVGIVITGTPGCVHTVTITDENMNINQYDVNIEPDGFGYLNIVVPPNSLIEVGSDNYMTGPGPLPQGEPLVIPLLSNAMLIVLLLMIGMLGFRQIRLK